jgi:Mn2+/Fe2+ NRAMP family transporter
MTPYEVFFFSSGGVEEGWKVKDLGEMRLNVFVGFPLGGVLSLSILACAAVYLFPAGVQVDHLSQTALPVSASLGKLGLAVVLLGFFAATFGALLETLMSTGYTVAQYFGWTWGKMVRPREASRFHTVLILALVLGVAVVLTSVDPIKVTEYSIVLSAAALPLTYLPILVVANDRRYLRERVNRWYTNTIATAYLLLILLVAVVTIPLMIATKAGL